MAINTGTALLLAAAIVAPLFAIIGPYGMRIDAATARLERSATLIAAEVRNAVAIADTTLLDVVHRVEPSDLLDAHPSASHPATTTSQRLDALQTEPDATPVALYDAACRLRYGDAILHLDEKALDDCRRRLHAAPLGSSVAPRLPSHPHTPAIVRTRTVFHPDGSVAGFAALAIDLTTFTGILQRSNLPDGSTALLLDTAFTIVAREPAIANATGHPLQHPQLSDMAHTSGGFVTERIDAPHGDTEHLVTVHPLPDLPFIVVTSEPRDAYLAGFSIRAFSISLYVLLLSTFVILTTREYHRTRRRRDELEDLVHVDALTRIANRRAFDAALIAALARSRRTGTPLSLVMIDLDRFKGVNDQYGHHVGDAMLTAASSAIGKAIREGDLHARLGGDEFAVLLPDTDQPGARHVTKRISEEVSALRVQTTSGVTVTTSMSIGVATTRRDAPESMAELMQRADEVMYAVKRRRTARPRRAPRRKATSSRPVAE